MSEWFYRLIDHIGESREVVHVAMGALDRYVAVQSRNESADSANSLCHDQRAYQCASMTALLLAIKCHGGKDRKDSNGTPLFGAKDLLRTGKGNVTAAELASTARRMIDNISWPSAVAAPSAFVRLFVSLAILSADESQISVSVVSTVLETAVFLVDASVCDLTFSGLRPSEIAYAAFINALDQQANSSVDADVRTVILDEIERNCSHLRRDSLTIRGAYLRQRTFFLSDLQVNACVGAGGDDREKGDNRAAPVPNVIPCDDDDNHVVKKFTTTMNTVSCSSNIHIIGEATRIIPFNSDPEGQGVCLESSMKRSPMKRNLIQDLSSFQKRSKIME